MQRLNMNVDINNRIQDGVKPSEVFVFIWIETKHYTSACYDYRPSDQIGIRGHHANGVRARWRIVFHLLLAIGLVSRVQELGVIPVANQFLKLLRAQAFLVKIAEVQLHATILERRSSFSARRSSWFVQKFDGFLLSHAGRS